MKHPRMCTGQTRSRRAVTVIAIGAVLAASACSSSASNTSGGSSGAAAAGGSVAAAKNAAAIAKLPADVKQRGSIVVAMDVSSPPNHFMDTDGKTIVGVDADIAKLLGQALGLKVTIAGANFDAIIPGLAGKKYDIAIAQMSPTLEREKVLDFVDYFSSGTAVAVAAGNPLKMTIDSMCGRKIAVLKGSFQESTRLPEYSAKCKTAGKGAIAPSSFPDQQATVLALTSGRVDGVMQDSPVLAYAQKKGAAIEVAGVAHVSAVGIGITKGSGMLDPIHTAMESLITSKAYKQALEKWGVGAGAVTDAKVNDNS
ncbi:MAG: polar amino acid transport system substrate-binding protein [Pseudonocardiales bacterium]|jgi:polar amino acid transport system substrate-binding protein|nr:transporter substrate-binding protein [Jatrophihabitans sp.]MDT4931051.1 polar amino acid transport system substrate-binding protein [Pseudonocardiales bacterium]MDT4951101.1 polar amino acid transport system substrate-binding protein [Pseudonocardiales bacterium]